MAEEVKKRKYKDVELDFVGDRIVLPKNMSEDEAIEHLKEKKQEREKVVAFQENIDGYPVDAALALTRVMKSRYGWVKMTDTPSFFGPNPPKILSVPCSLTETAQIIWGRFEVPGLAGFLQTGVVFDKNIQPVFQLQAQTRNKDRDAFSELAALVRADLKENSIYRGKAIKVAFPDFRRVPFDPTVHVPQFLDVREATLSELIFNHDISRAIRVSIFTPITHSERVKKVVGTLKRGILLAGPPGTGKTLTAHATARLCEENGWSFIYLSNTGDLAQAVEFGKKYSPAVIFAEDLDSIVNTEVEDEEERDSNTMAVLNILDGVDSKKTDLMVVFTTNYPDKIANVMKRPGRIDAMIELQPPNALAVEALLRMYGRGLIREGSDLSHVAERLKGQIPAVVREVVERAKLAAIPHTDEDSPLELYSADLEDAVDSMLNQISMLARRTDLKPSDLEKAAHVLGHVLTNALRNAGQSESVRASSDGLGPMKITLPLPDENPFPQDR
jgi:transitional endoplasmic reticulum ATPase